MVVTRENENVIIKVNPAIVGMNEIQKTIDYFRLLESNAQNCGTQEEADELARESHRQWLLQNRDRISKL